MGYAVRYESPFGYPATDLNSCCIAQVAIRGADKSKEASMDC